MNQVNNDKYYDPEKQPSKPDTKQAAENHWENEEYREGRELRRCPVHPKHNRYPVES